MRDTLRLLGIIALAVIIGLSMVACDNGSTTDTGDKTPVADNYIVSGTGTQTVGQAIAVTVTRKENASPGEITVLYNGNSTAPSPSSEGSYLITFDVAAASGWKEARGLAGGLLVIIGNAGGNPAPLATDFNYTGMSQTYTGERKRLGITPKDSSKTNGVITIYYDGKASPAFEPIEEGTYKVTFNVDATNLHASATGLIAPDLVITPAPSEVTIPPVPEDFHIFGIGNFAVDGSERYVYITPKEGKSNGQITIWYGDSGIPDKAPTANGQYRITFDVTASGSYSAVKGLYAGMLIIDGKEVLLEYFDISGLSQVWDGTPKGVKVRAKAEHQVLSATPKYKWSDASVLVSNAPYQVGEYDVYIDVPKATGYVGTSESLFVGKLEIAETGGTTPAPASLFSVEGLGNYTFDANMERRVSVNTPGRGGVITVIYTDAYGIASEDAPIHTGTYDVSYNVGSSAANAGNTIPAGKLTINKVAPVLGDFVLEKSVQYYDGDQKMVIIKAPKLGNIDSFLNIRYDGSETAPRNAGKYKVKFNLAETPDWLAVSDLEVGEMEVLKGTPQSKDYKVTLPPNKPFDDVQIGEPGISFVTGYPTTDGAPSFTYNGEAARPKNAGTYAVVLKLAGTTNWNEKEDSVGSVTISPRPPTKEDFVWTGWPQVAYSFTQQNLPRIDVRTDIPVAYPGSFVSRQPAIRYTNSTGGNVSGLNGLNAQAPGKITATVTIPAATNWAGPTSLVWEFDIELLLFETADAFVTWYNGRPATGTYSAKFATTADLQATELAKVTKAIQDRGTYDPGPTVNNRNRLLKLDLSGVTSIVTLAGSTVTNGFKDCDNLLELNLTGCTGLTSATMIDANTFSGCSKLEKLLLPVEMNTDTLTPADVLKDCVSLKVLDTGGLSSISKANLTLDSTKVMTLQDVTLRGLLVDTDGNRPFEGMSSLKNLTLAGTAAASDKAFLNCAGLETVTFVSNTTTAYAQDIGISAFEGCVKLNTVNFPVNWTLGRKIGANAFKGCTSLKSVSLPAGLTAATPLADNSFAGCTGLTYVSIVSPAATTKAFSGLTGLSEVMLADGVETISPDAFKGCTGLTKITIPDSVTDIGSSAFEGCAKLGSISFNTDDTDGVTAIGNRAFFGCTLLTSIELPTHSGYDAIGLGTFYGTGLTSIELPENVLAINGDSNAGTTGGGAFENCRSLVSVVYDATTTPSTIQAYAFAGCINLKEFIDSTSVDPEDPGYDETLLGKINLPEALAPEANAFRGCTSITDVIFTNASGSPTYVGQAFTNCSSLRSIKFTGNGTSTISFGTGNNAVSSIKTIIWDSTTAIAAANDFRGTTADTLVVSKTVDTLTSAGNTFPSTLTTLRLEANQGSASGGTFITLPNSVTKVFVAAHEEGGTAYTLTTNDDTAMFNANVTYIEFEGEVGACVVTDANAFYGIEKFTLKVNTPYTAADGLNQFSGLDNITNVILGPKVTPAIPASVVNSAELISVDVLDGNPVMLSDSGVLYGAAGRTVNTLIKYPPKKPGNSIYPVLPGVSNIATGAFAGNANITGVEIPASVTAIGDIFDAANTALRTIIYKARDATMAAAFPTSITTLTIENGVEKIPTPFLGGDVGDLTTLNNLIIPASVKSIGTTSFAVTTYLPTIKNITLNANLLTEGAFSGIVGVEQVNIGSGVMTIPANTFNGAKVLNLNLGSVEYIGTSAFASTAINSVNIPASVITIEDTAFATCTSLQQVVFATDTVNIVANTSFPTGSGGAFLKVEYEKATGGSGLYANSTSGGGAFGWEKR